uniref:Uncharacterized protein n=1 Tax=Amphimedon queenslandica TaxID=400682 RepID=A0A1X7VSG8_AMPQE
MYILKYRNCFLFYYHFPYNCVCHCLGTGFMD